MSSGENINAPPPPVWATSFLWLLLPILAAVVWWDGQRYDASLLSFKAEPGAALAALLPETLGDLSRQGPVRTYTRETLYEYVNGHAEFFIGAGFASLAAADYGEGLTVDLYDMGTPLNAFGTLMEERGSAGESMDAGEMGFSHARGALFMVGPYYVKLTAFQDGWPLAAWSKALAQGLGASAGGALAFDFPDFGPAAATHYVRENYRGLDFFKGVVERTFEREGRRVTAFLIQKEVPAVEKALRAFLAEEEMAVGSVKVGALSVMTVADPYEGDWFYLVDGARFLGVSRAFDPALVGLLSEWVGE